MDIEIYCNYFDNPQSGVTANKQYSTFVRQLLIKNRNIERPILSFNLKGEITLRYNTVLCIEICEHLSENENEVIRDIFDIVIQRYDNYNYNGPRDITLTSNDKDSIDKLFKCFYLASNVETLIKLFTEYLN